MKESIRRFGDRSRTIIIAAGLLCLLLVFLLLIFQSGRLLLLFVTGLLLLGSGLVWYFFSLRSFHSGLQSDLDRLHEQAQRATRNRSWRAADENPGSDMRFVEIDRLQDAINEINQQALRDIGELKRLEQVRSQFLGNVSHELRTPIFTVQGFLETLIDGAVDDPEVRDEFLQKAHDNLLRLHSLLNDLIEISRIESGEMKMSFRFFDLVDLAQGTLINLRDTAETGQVTMNLDVSGVDDEGKISVYGDRKRIEQALVNLMVNAIKYNQPGGTSELRIRPNANDVVVEVRDTGIGISDEHLSRIFERFYRVDKGRSREIGGSGLGLSIVKHIIEAHGTRITVESVPGEGTTFRFTLPRYD